MISDMIFRKHFLLPCFSRNISDAGNCRKTRDPGRWPSAQDGTRDPYLKLRPNHVGWHRRVNLVFLLYSTTFPVHSHHIQPSIHSQLPEAMWLVRGWFLPALRPSWMNLRWETYENRGSTVKLTLKHLKKHLKIPWVEVTQSLKWLKYVKIC